MRNGLQPSTLDGYQRSSEASFASKSTKTRTSASSCCSSKSLCSFSCMPKSEARRIGNFTFSGAGCSRGRASEVGSSCDRCSTAGQCSWRFTIFAHASHGLSTWRRRRVSTCGSWRRFDVTSTGARDLPFPHSLGAERIVRARRGSRRTASSSARLCAFSSHCGSTRQLQRARQLVSDVASRARTLQLHRS